MKKSLLMKTMLLLFALVTGSTCAWADTTVSYGWEDGDDATAWTIANTIVKTENQGNTGTYAGKINTNHTYVQFNQKVYVTSFSFAFKRTSSNSNYNVFIETSTDGTNWTAAETYTMGSFNNGSYTTKTKTFDGNTQYYVRFHCYNTTAVRYVDDVTITYTEGSSDPAISLSSKSVNASAEDTDGTINVTYNNIASVDAEVKFYESDGTTAATYDWIDAEIDNSNNLYYVIGANTGDARTAYMKVHQKNTEVYSELITVTQEAYDPVAVTLDFTDTGWGFPSDYTKTEESYTNDGYTIVVGATAADGHKAFVYNSEQVALIFGKNGAQITLPTFDFNISKIKVYGRSGAATGVKFNIFVDDVEVSDEATGSDKDHEFAIAADKQAAGTVYVLKLTTTDKNCQISKIDFYGYETTPAVTSAGWATYVTKHPVFFEEGDAFVVSAANATTATLTGVTKIRANQPVILKGEGAKTAIVLSEAPAVSNELAISIGGSIDGFVLAKPAGKSAGFYKWNGGSLTSGKVYLPAPTAARDYLEFTFDGESETTSISEIETMRNVGNETFYNLNGQKVQNPTKGLYIVNGKKVIIK